MEVYRGDRYWQGLLVKVSLCRGIPLGGERGPQEAALVRLGASLV